MGQIKYAHGKLRNFNITDGIKEATQVMLETCAQDVLLETENQNIPSNITRLSDLVSQLSTYAFHPDDTTLVEKYAGHGAPPSSLVASAGDRYVDLDTGHIYEYRGLNELQGYQKISLTDKYICTQMDDNVYEHWDSTEVNNIIDDDLDTVGYVRRARRIVFDLGKKTDIGKISLSFKEYSGYYKYTYVSISNDTPSSYVVGEAHGMTWTDIAAGYGIMNGVTGVQVESNTIDSATGTGTITLTIDHLSHEARYVSLWSGTNDIYVANFDLYSHPSEDAVPTRWVMTEEEIPKLDLTKIIRFGSSLASDQDTGAICFVTDQQGYVSKISQKTGEDTETTYPISVKSEYVSTNMGTTLDNYLDSLENVLGDMGTTQPSDGITYQEVTEKVSQLSDESLSFLQAISTTATGVYNISGNINIVPTLASQYPSINGEVISTKDYVSKQIDAVKTLIPSTDGFLTADDFDTRLETAMCSVSYGSSTGGYFLSEISQWANAIIVNSATGESNFPEGTLYYGGEEVATSTDLETYMPKTGGTFSGSVTFSADAYISSGYTLRCATYGTNLSIVSSTSSDSVTYGKYAGSTSTGMIFGNRTGTGSLSVYFGYNYNTTNALYNHFGYNPITSGTIYNIFGSSAGSGWTRIYGCKTNGVQLGYTSTSDDYPVYLRGTTNKVVGTSSGKNTIMHFSSTEPTNMAVGDVWFKIPE